jgi:hypothetical protein
MGSTITEIEVDSARGDSVRFSAVSNFMIATNPTENPTHRNNSDKPDQLKTTRLPLFSRPDQPERLLKTNRNSLLINRFRVQVPAGAPEEGATDALEKPSICCLVRQFRRTLKGLFIQCLHHSSSR